MGLPLYLLTVQLTPAKRMIWLERTLYPTPEVPLPARFTQVQRGAAGWTIGLHTDTAKPQSGLQS